MNLPRRHRSILITGAGGYLGSLLLSALVEKGKHRITAVDICPPEPQDALSGVCVVREDVRSPRIGDLFQAQRVDTVVHLASIVTPGKRSDRAFEYSVDVLGTRNVLEGCVAHGVEKIIVTSSGAAYGYHPDNAPWMEEDSPLRGNPAFAYAYHKRLVEEMLARYRERHPRLRQLIFRPGTILGRGTHNQITALFERPVILGVRGAATPFVFVWDRDVVGCLLKGIEEPVEGIYNLAGDGVMALREIAAAAGRPYLPLPAGMLRAALAVLKAARLTQYGPEQVDFLRYRPVLSNRKLKEEFGYVPLKTTREAFEVYLGAARRRRAPGLSGEP